MSLSAANRDQSWSETGYPANEFHPERFEQPTPRLLSFGGGADICPGRLLATMAVKTGITEVLSRYDLQAEGEMKFTSDAVYHLENPEIQVSPRT